MTFLRVGDAAAGEQGAELDFRGFDLAHVFQNEDRHLACPVRNVGVARMGLDGAGVAQRQGQIVQAVLGDQRVSCLGRPRAGDS